MSKAIEAMKEEGWEGYTGTVKFEPDIDMTEFEGIVMIRPKAKPNAIVDWEKVDEIHSNWLKEYNRGPMCSVCLAAYEELRAAIKKVEP